MAQKIKVNISPNPFTGLGREVEIAQIAFLDWDIAEAQVKFRINHLRDGEVIQGAGSSYEKVIHISNANKVTEQGVTITKDYVHSISTLDKDSETYEQDLEAEYQKAFEKGTPEFDMWISMAMQLTLEGALIQGVKLLDSFKYFD